MPRVHLSLAGRIKAAISRLHRRLCPVTRTRLRGRWQRYLGARKGRQSRE